MPRFDGMETSERPAQNLGPVGTKRGVPVLDVGAVVVIFRKQVEPPRRLNFKGRLDYTSRRHIIQSGPIKIQFRRSTVRVVCPMSPSRSV